MYVCTLKITTGTNRERLPIDFIYLILCFEVQYGDEHTTAGTQRIIVYPARNY